MSTLNTVKNASYHVINSEYEFASSKIAFQPFDEEKPKCDEYVTVTVNTKKGTTTLEIEAEGDQNTYRTKALANFKTSIGRLLQVEINSRPPQNGLERTLYNKDVRNLDPVNISNLPIQNGNVRAQSTRYMSRATYSTPEYKGLNFEDVNGKIFKGGVCEQLIGDRIKTTNTLSTLIVSDGSGWTPRRIIELKNKK